ncbi:peptide deformylase [Paenibacillus athensensis]|uniref:Peptide deformylase n=1 Tax=Paenibacillus athensensis TaxID=1967502 RepID=A0A4Y8PZ59_9BACL|nr:peptide deformylase [Paenibacillus athensensis]MCD1261493.1 peptide deformylase [Paenibacillus athensensis]
MAVKEILPFGDAVLRKTAREVELPLSPKMLKLLDDMAETLYAADGRAGLAAPQVGILRRLIVLDCGDGLVELINPEIVEARGEQIGLEACLSYPGFMGNVKRAQYVRVKTFNRQGETVMLEGEGFTARCFQHEIDHLNGVLFVDRMTDRWLVHEQTQATMPLLDVIKLTNSGL